VAKITGTAGTAAPPPRHIYRVVEVIDGREVVRYTNEAPKKR
jgi:hypothetical protein